MPSEAVAAKAMTPVEAVAAKAMTAKAMTASELHELSLLTFRRNRFIGRRVS